MGETLPDKPKVYEPIGDTMLAKGSTDRERDQTPMLPEKETFASEYKDKWAHAPSEEVNPYPFHSSCGIRHDPAEMCPDFTKKVPRVPHTVTQKDQIHHPAHYATGDIECIDAIHAALGRDAFIAHCKACVMKYLWRSELKKAPQLDLEKAQVYLQWAVDAGLGQPLTKWEPASE